MHFGGLRRDWVALLASLGAPAAVTALLVPFRDHIANTDTALILVGVVVAISANGNRVAGYLAAASSALWFDVFMTEPYGRLTITREADVETTVLLLLIGIAVTELGVWARGQHSAASQRAGYLKGIFAAAEASVTSTRQDSIVRLVTDEITQLLALRSCRFEIGIAGLGAVGRLHRDGNITVKSAPWSTVSLGLPPDGPIELLVERGGVLCGRFLMTGDAASRPTLEKRLVAVALADQVGSTLARQQQLAT